MKIQVLGSGCPTCKKLFEITQQAVEELGTGDEPEYITGIEGTQRIIELGEMTSPILVVDSKVVLVGFTPDLNKIKNAISDAGK